ncbi:hypothetical protein B0I72DRAFT_167148 [Yarrowia lipolytica]|uniref:Uncharacterized protein n=1 Tax=Yarrowia lipolytica TaxID=4952 RepID=A0A371CCJ8_YARLL|nr:hypothetical protein B0I71DRAFT_157200 [Yarrowia lipolytica]RDW34123.1 hypothetical protein B0I72DRAFT_167148 [Yarrowia lipolytica]RDW37021.1 hypothetical protein B0I73DRAFT_177114 [Yarrowia lipolytica]RDW43500.1 hypothetical protein B0I74DRAFT_170192 [Yarrowia lipolytica]RDW54379.1 hypothetical protein B0I75DRAFT_162839 [Yarrowia lipolytica]
MFSPTCLQPVTLLSGALPLVFHDTISPRNSQCLLSHGSSRFWGRDTIYCRREVTDILVHTSQLTMYRCCYRKNVQLVAHVYALYSYSYSLMHTASYLIFKQSNRGTYSTHYDVKPYIQSILSNPNCYINQVEPGDLSQLWLARAFHNTKPRFFITLRTSHGFQGSLLPLVKALFVGLCTERRRVLFFCSPCCLFFVACCLLLVACCLLLVLLFSYSTEVHLTTSLSPDCLSPHLLDVQLVQSDKTS